MKVNPEEIREKDLKYTFNCSTGNACIEFSKEMSEIKNRSLWPSISFSLYKEDYENFDDVLFDIMNMARPVNDITSIRAREVEFGCPYNDDDEEVHWCAKTCILDEVNIARAADDSYAIISISGRQ